MKSQVILFLQALIPAAADKNKRDAKTQQGRACHPKGR
jgi:hypothetical protein